MAKSNINLVHCKATLEQLASNCHHFRAPSLIIMLTGPREKYLQISIVTRFRAVKSSSRSLARTTYEPDHFVLGDLPLNCHLAAVKVSGVYAEWRRWSNGRSAKPVLVAHLIARCGERGSVGCRGEYISDECGRSPFCRQPTSQSLFLASSRSNTPIICASGNLARFICRPFFRPDSSTSSTVRKPLNNRLRTRPIEQLRIRTH